MKFNKKQKEGKTMSKKLLKFLFTFLTFSLFLFISCKTLGKGKYDSGYNIFDAIRNGSLQRVSEIIEADGSQIEIAYNYNEDEGKYKGYKDIGYHMNGSNPLSFAAFYGDKKIIEYLLSNIDDESVLLHTDDEGWNAFAYACGFGTVDTIKILAQEYSDSVNWKNPYGANGLHMAALQGNIPVLDYLVNDLKIDINSTNDEGEGVLYYARDEETEDALIKLGAKN